MNFLTKMVDGVSTESDSFIPYTAYPVILFLNAIKRFSEENIGNKVLVGFVGEIMGLALAVFMFLETVVVALLVGLILLGLSVQAKIENKMKEFALHSKIIGKNLGQRVGRALAVSFFSGPIAAGGCDQD